MKKKELSMLLSAVLILSLLTFLPMLVLSADASTTQVGDLTVTGGTLDTDFSYWENTLYVKTGTPLTVSGTTTQDKIVVESGVTANVTLKDLSIDVSACAFSVLGTANITLVGDNTLKSYQYETAGLEVEREAAVTIGGEGSLTAMCTYNYSGGAGIGGSKGSSGTITITGGTIIAKGGIYAAGIGGRFGCSGDITITGGTVTATGRSGAAGIGGGYGYWGSRITISGGTVIANSADDWGGGIGDGAKAQLREATFSTGENGNAWIVTDSISDCDDTSAWSGVIVQGTTGKMYGSIQSATVDTDMKFPAGCTFTIEAGQTLTVSKGVTLTNEGSIINHGTFQNNGTYIGNETVTNTGTLINAGTFTANGAVTNDGRLQNTGTYTASGTVTNTDTIINTGTFNASGAVINKGQLQNDGTYTGGGTMTNTGTILNTDAYTESGTVTNDGQLQNNGTYTAGDAITNTDTIINTGTFNASGAVINKGQLQNDGTYTGGGTMTNTGTILNTDCLYRKRYGHQ